MTEAILARLARGEPLSVEEWRAVRAVRAGRFMAVRRAADVLATAHARSRSLRSLGTELFRGQFEFNHQLVDLLEEQPWLAKAGNAREAIGARLAPWRSWRSRIVRKPGVRGAAVWLVKRALVLSTRVATDAALRDLERSNDALAAAIAADKAERGWWLQAALDAAAHRGLLAPWFAAQRAFIEELARFFRAPTPGFPPAPTLVRDDPRWVLRLPEGESWLGVPAECLDADVDLIYGDSMWGTERQLRPAWSREHLWNETFVGAFLMRRSFVEAHGLTPTQPALVWLLCSGLRPERTLRVAEVTSVRDGALPESDPREPEVVKRDLARLGLDGEVVTVGTRRQARLRPSRYRKVSIIVPFQDKTELLRGLLRTMVRNEAGIAWELILASNNSAPSTLNYLKSLSDARVRWFEWNEPFNFSRINNVAAARASGDVLLFLNNDIETRHQNWLAALVGYLEAPGVAAVGSRLLYPDGSIQHAGVVIGLRGLAGHVFARWRPEYGRTPYGWPDVTRPWSAVTGACLLMERARFEDIGGFDETMQISGSDVELCLRACASTERVICVGHAELTHLESQSRGRAAVPLSDVHAEASAYARVLDAGDPWYHPRLSLEVGNGYEFAGAPPLEHRIAVLAELAHRAG